MAKAQKEEAVKEVKPTKLKKAEVNFDGDTLTIDFVEAGSVVVDAAKLPEEIQHQLMLHGLKQKVCDSYSGIRGQEAEDTANAVITQLQEGNWAVARSSGGGGAVRVTLLAEAIANISGKPIADVNAMLATLAESDEGKEKLKLLRQDVSVKQAIAKIKLDKATKESKEAKGEDSVLSDLIA